MALFSKLCSILQKSELVHKGHGLASRVLKVYSCKMRFQCFPCQMKVIVSNILGFCVVMAQAPVVGVHFIDDIVISLTIHNP